ncbi:MAG: hypothetical protein DYH06_11650 [Acidobacteria bacterium ACB2]|nr:hypothetical protein [Acidobacteria bacterium ACB2]
MGFQQVLSPGLFLVWGIKGAPLSVALGASYAPQLRKLREEPSGTTENALRIGLAVALDIPLFP